jgi:hypothetical protein
MLDRLSPSGLRLNASTSGGQSMNESWFGDSSDVVKRFFVEVIKANGYAVYADGMFTGHWRSEADFFRFLGANDVDGAVVVRPSALFLDPDTGVGNRLSKRHTTVAAIVERLREHDIVFVFDQAFSRALPARRQAMQKLRKLQDLGALGF